MNQNPDSNHNKNIYSSDEEFGNYSVMKKDLNKVPMGSSRNPDVSKNSSRVFPIDISPDNANDEASTSKRIDFKDVEVRQPPKSPRPERKQSRPGNFINNKMENSIQLIWESMMKTISITNLKSLIITLYKF